MKYENFQYIVVLTGLIILLAAFSGCKKRENSGKQYKRNVTDMLDRKVELPAQINKVVGIGPGALRLLVYMEATEKVCGVEEIETRKGRPYIYAHPDLAKKPIIGPAFTGDAELIVKRNPDVIFKTYTNAAEANELERKTGIPVIALQYANQDSDWTVLKTTLRKMGKILNKHERAQDLIQYFSSTIDTLQKKTKAIPKKEKEKVYLGGLSHRGTHGINSTSPYYEPFAFVHARNVASSLKENYDNNEGVLLDIEQIIEWNPEVIFIDLAGYKLVIQDIRDNKNLFKSLRASENNRIYGVHPYNWYTTNYATILANAWYIAKILYPERFHNIDPVKKANEIYRMFLGKEVYHNLSEEFGKYKKLDMFKSLE